MQDNNVLKHIEDLVAEEDRFLAAADLSTADQKRLDAIKIELDQYWDFLRQRRALRDAGEDPSAAKIRSAGIVENYEQ